MSISTPQGGGARRPSVTKPAAGAKPKSGAGAKPKPVDEDQAVVDDVDVLEDEADELDAAEADPRPGVKTTKTVSRSTSRSRGTTTTTGARPDRSATKTATKPAVKAKAATRPGGKAGGPPRKTFAPVKVAGNRNWGPIALFVSVVLVSVGIIGYGGYQVWKNGLTAQERASRISGITDYTKTNKDLLKPAQHQWGPIKYDQNPPVGGPHNQNWQRCMGDVYNAPIASEHAVHAMEHGAVWLTYRPDLPADQVTTLADKVKGNDFMLMSPFEGLDKAVSLQAWGYQLKVDSVSDKRIDDFIKALRQQVGPEKGATCSSGDFISETGTTPRDIGKDAAPAGEPGAQPGG